MEALEILKKIGYDNRTITHTEKWIAKEVYKLALSSPPVDIKAKESVKEYLNKWIIENDLQNQRAPLTFPQIALFAKSYASNLNSLPPPITDNLSDKPSAKEFVNNSKSEEFKILAENNWNGVSTYDLMESFATTRELTGIPSEESELIEWLHKTMEGRHLLNKITFPLSNHFETHPEKIPDKLVVELINALSRLSKTVETKEGKPKTVCFCGSTRFAQTFMVERWELEKKGIITLGINILPDGYFEGENHHGAEQEGVKDVLDELHKRKIDISDEVVILNVDGYIGDSTRSELEYAKSIGKPIKYLEPLPEPPK